MYNSTTHPLHLIGLAVITLLMFCQPGKAVADAEICNNGDNWVYFAALAWKKSPLIDEALVEGFTPIEPGKCSSIVPYGMSRIYISLFMYDKHGRITNPVLTPRNADQKPDFIKKICVQPQNAFRRYSTRGAIQKNYTPPCPTGYITAKTSFFLINGDSNYTLNLDYEPNTSASVWGRQYGEKRILQTIWNGERAGQTAQIQENKALARDRKALKALARAAGDFLDKAKKRQAIENARRYQAYMARKEAFERRVDTARKQLEKPDDTTCSPFLEKASYDDFETVAVAGVQIDMDVNTAHKAIICNGFTLYPAMIARAGGLEKLLKNPRPIKYFREAGTNIRHELEIETRPFRDAPRNQPYRIVSVRKRIFDFGGIDNTRWQSIQDAFVGQYDLGRARRTQLFVHYKDRDNGRVIKLDPELKTNPMTSYTITLCCGR